MRQRTFFFVLGAFLVASCLAIFTQTVSARLWMAGDENYWTVSRVCRDGAEIRAVFTPSLDPDLDNTYGQPHRVSARDYSAFNPSIPEDFLYKIDNNQTVADFGPELGTTAAYEYDQHVDLLTTETTNSSSLLPVYTYALKRIYWKPFDEGAHWVAFIDLLFINDQVDEFSNLRVGFWAPVENCFLRQVPDPAFSRTIQSNSFAIVEPYLEPDQVSYRLNGQAQLGDLRNGNELLLTGSYFTQDDLQGQQLAYTQSHLGSPVTEVISYTVRATQRVGQHSYVPSISADGRYVAFYSFDSNLVPGDTNNLPDAFVKDLLTGSLERVSVSSSNNQGNDGTYETVISADGRYVAFASDASNLVSGDSNGVTDIFVHDRDSGVTERVSIATNGQQGNSYSFDMAISNDGHYVAFASYADNLVSADTNNAADIFVHDRVANQTVRVSINSGGEAGNFDSYGPSISADGNRIAFYSYATNLDTLVQDDQEDFGNFFDIFVRDRQAGVTLGVTRRPGVQAGGDSFGPVLTADGKWVAFSSDAPNLGSGGDDDYCDTNGDGSYSEACSDIFMMNLETGNFELASVPPSNSAEAGAFVDRYYHAYEPSVSQDGRFIAFNMKIDGSIVPPESLGMAAEILVRDRTVGETYRASVSSQGIRPNDHSWSPALSADGRYVAFESQASNLVAGDDNDISDVFIHRLETTAMLTIDIPIKGLSARAGLPEVPAGLPVTLIAEILQGSNVVYTWSFGDGGTASGSAVSHAYPAPGVYTATVTARNSTSEVTTSISIRVTSAQGHKSLYLPFVPHPLVTP